MIEKPERSGEKPPKRPLFTRREALIGGAAALGALATGPKLVDVGDQVFSKEELVREVAALAREIQARFGITVHFDEFKWSNEYASEELYEAAKLRAMGYLVAELQTYPKLILHTLPVHAVTFRSNLMARTPRQEPLEGTVIDGTYNSDKGLVLDVGGHSGQLYRNFGWNEEMDFHSNFSHEFFHAADTLDDSAWLQSFPPPPNISYSTEILDDVIPGYALPYGLAAPAEDRATIYEALATGNEVFLSRLNTDRVLAAKTARIKDYMAAVSGGLINNEYWQQRSQADFSNRAEAFFRGRARELVAQDYDQFSVQNPSLAVDTSRETYGLWQSQAREDYLRTGGAR